LPINPYSRDEFILDERVFKRLEDIKINIDIFNVFRSSSEVYSIIKHAVYKNIKTMWLQLDIFWQDSEKILDKMRINLIQDKCIKTEHSKLLNN